MSAPSFNNTDYIWMEQQHRDLRILAGELHDAFEMDDPSECLVKCDGIAAIASEVRAFVQKRAAERRSAQGRIEQETAIPPVEVGGVA